MGRRPTPRGRAAALAAAIGLIVILPVLAPNQFLVKLSALSGIAVLLATGLNLIFGYAGQVSLGHAAFYGIGAYATAILTTKAGWPSVAALVAGVALAGIAAWLVGVPALRLKGHYLAMATLGFNEIVAIVLVQAKPLTNGTDGLGSIPPLSLGPVVIASNAANHYVVWACVLLGLWTARNLVAGRSGRSVRALHDSEVAAEASAVDTGRAKTSTFVISALYAGLAGALYAHFVSFISPVDFVVAASVTIVTMVVIGGMGTVLGPLLGGVLLTVGPEFLRSYQDYTLLVYGSLLIAVLIFWPQGLAGLVSRRKRGVR